MIELLAVIAVIGILASLLLPALARSKAVAKRIHCVGNVKHLALAAYLYADDNSDWFPSAIWTDWPADDPRLYPGGITGWHLLLLYGYLDENTNVFQCAANSRLKKVFPTVTMFRHILILILLLTLLTVGVLTAPKKNMGMQRS